MRYLVISDVHGNWEALQAVLRHARRKRYGRVLFLGDAVGYGASPNLVVDWLRSLGQKVVAIRGNHDRVCSGLDTAETFNRYAREASEWTHRRLSPRNLAYLRDLPEGPAEVERGLVICHGSLLDEDEYLFAVHDAQASLLSTQASVILFGHTHVPSLFELRPGDGHDILQARLLAGRRTVLDLEPDNRYLINPGSVGQARDRDPRAAYAIYDHDRRRLYHYRVEYPVEAARRRIHQAGLPPVLGDRLLFGA
ncbi:MAG: metallophosphoesterase family protein [Acidobacteria bacterium]|nr:metallophosphoesterase family protein [Acidobacteriota bacterium]